MKNNGIKIAETVLSVMATDADPMISALAFVWEPLQGMPCMDVLDQIGAMERVLGFKCVRFEDDTYLMIFDLAYERFMDELKKHIIEINEMAICCA